MDAGRLHRDVQASVAADVDVESGLAAILNEEIDNLPPETFAVAMAPTMHASDKNPVVKVVSELEPTQRLKLRGHLFGRSFDLAAARFQCRDLAAELGNLIILDHLRALERSLTRARDRIHRHDLDCGSDMTRALTSAHALTDALSRLLDKGRVIARNIPWDEARVGAQEVASTIDRSLTRAMVFVRDVADVRERIASSTNSNDLEEIVDRMLRRAGECDPVHARTLAKNLDKSLLRAINNAFDREAARELPSRGLSAALRQTPADERAATLVWLRNALDDVVGADLREADLAEVPLAGLRWSARTQWPPDWLDKIRSLSRPDDSRDGVFVIQDDKPIPVSG